MVEALRCGYCFATVFAMAMGDDPEDDAWAGGRRWFCHVSCVE